MLYRDAMQREQILTIVVLILFLFEGTQSYYTQLQASETSWSSEFQKLNLHGIKKTAM